MIFYSCKHDKSASMEVCSSLIGIKKIYLAPALALPFRASQKFYIINIHPIIMVGVV